MVNTTTPPSPRAEFEALCRLLILQSKKCEGHPKTVRLNTDTDHAWFLYEGTAMKLAELVYDNRAVIAAALDVDARPMSIFGLPDGSTLIVSAEAALPSDTAPDTLPSDWRPRPDANGD